jgi:hypothetical protein
MNKTIKSNLDFTLKSFAHFKTHLSTNPRLKLALIGIGVFGSIYTISVFTENNKVVFRDYQSPKFEKGRIFGSQASSYLQEKKNQLSKTARKIMSKNKILEERLMKLEKRLEVKS